MPNKKIIYVGLSTFFIAFLLFKVNIVFAQETPTPTSVESTPTSGPTSTPTSTPKPGLSADDAQQLKDLQDKIKQYEQKIADIQGQEKTLSSQIQIMDNQINLTELRVTDIKQKVLNLQKDVEITRQKISNLQNNINIITQAMIQRIVAVYEFGRADPLHIFLTSDNISNFLTRLQYLKIVQISDKKNVYASEQAKVDYSNQKGILEDKQKEEEALKKKLEVYSNQLEDEKESKQELLAITKNDEDRYQQLLQEAKKQISAFKSFALSQSGGSVSILPPQSSPDGWYYNQRDERWGRNLIGASSEQMWEGGCLVASVTMVLKKHGSNVTPADIASSSSYYFSDTAYMLLPWAGGKFTSVWGLDQSAIDNKLSAGEPVIVGLRAGPLGMHFVVLKSGSGGNYTMNDPWYGADLKFGDYYSTSQIFQYGFYNG